MTISLQDKTILVTREPQTAQHFANQISAYGGRAVITPLLRIQCLPYSLKDKTNVSEHFDWIFFTSKNGVNCFMKQRPNLNGCKIAVVGPKTAIAVEKFGYGVDFIPTTYNAEVMAAEFLDTYKHSGLVLFVRGKLASPILLNAFTRAQRPYTCVEVYDTTINIAEKAHLCSSVREEAIDFITFTSPSTVDAFMQLTSEENQKDIPAVCIGTTTEKRALEVGFAQTIVPRTFTIEGMLEAIHKEIERRQ